MAEFYHFFLGKFLELLAIIHSSSEGRDIFVPWLLKLSHVLVVLQLTCMFWLFYNSHFHTVELDNMIQFSTLSRVLGFLWHSSKWACWFGCFLQYTSGLEVLTCSFNTDFSFVITILCSSLNVACA